MLFYGEQTVNESTNYGKIDASSMFNPNLLNENASIKELSVAIYESVDFLEEQLDILKQKDAAYDFSLTESTLVKLQEGVGEFVGKAVEWAKKIFNSIITFFKNTWLKLTNKWQYRQNLVKDKNTIAAASMATNDPDKWGNVSLTTMPNVTESKVDAVFTKINELTNKSNTDAVSDMKTTIKDLIEDLNEKEDATGSDAQTAFTTAWTMYSKGGIVKQANNLKKMQDSIKKVIDQFIKNIKAGKTTVGNNPLSKFKRTAAFGVDIKDTSAHGSSQTDKYDTGMDTYDKADDIDAAKTAGQDKARLEYDKKVIPLYAHAIQQMAGVIRANAEYKWKAVVKGISIGGGAVKELMKY